MKDQLLSPTKTIEAKLPQVQVAIQSLLDNITNILSESNLLSPKKVLILNGISISISCWLMAVQEYEAIKDPKHLRVANDTYKEWNKALDNLIPEDDKVKSVVEQMMASLEGIEVIESDYAKELLSTNQDAVSVTGLTRKIITLDEMRKIKGCD